MSSVTIHELWYTEGERGVGLQRKIGVQLPEKEGVDAGQTMTRYLLP